MAASFSIPTVTPDDLLQFHLNHFGKAFIGSSLSTSLDYEDQITEPLQHDENDLGYYSDGCPRTLTDEQIEIFRHSEVQRLLLKQRREAEAAAELSPEREAEESIKAQTVPKDDMKSNRRNEKSLFSNVSKRSKEQFVVATEKARNFSRQQHEEDYDRTVSTRRRVRELDDITKQDNVVLEY